MSVSYMTLRMVLFYEDKHDVRIITGPIFYKIKNSHRYITFRIMAVLHTHLIARELLSFFS